MNKSLRFQLGQQGFPLEQAHTPGARFSAATALAGLPPEAADPDARAIMHDAFLASVAGPDSMLANYDLHVLADRSGRILDSLTIAARVVKSITVGTAPNRVLGRTLRTRKTPSLALVCIDSIGLHEAVDLLQSFRTQHEDVPIVIASFGFKANDFSAERSVVADASVRLPTEPESMVWALHAAIDNRALRSYAA